MDCLEIIFFAWISRVLQNSIHWYRNVKYYDSNYQVHICITLQPSRCYRLNREVNACDSNIRTVTGRVEKSVSASILNKHIRIIIFNGRESIPRQQWTFLRRDRMFAAIKTTYELSCARQTPEILFISI